ncbi:phospholipase D-like domain-containing protein [Paenibacillus ginsengarvi]|uniref:PLD phosphodiesterase domain-containing protein n=1 Tax=Paenibacillus ginsengarvi TaxID=400777 RepID=A0A3B0B8E5_9BACL|nr:phospholipase D-like domain-containing protein [Paenibacillus ginsengarvi]RKN70083.1 hypothetical protein D7M11_31150 [Paenibacillus ginsengarvi]
MSIAADRQRYFWLAANDPVTATEPEPATYKDSDVTPLIDLFEYMEKFRQALDLVGTDPDPAKNRGDFIYISGWWLGLIGGTFVANRAFEGPPSGLDSTGPSVGDITAFDLDPLMPEVRLLDVLQTKARAGVDVRVMGWVSFSLLTMTPIPIPILGALINPVLANAIQRKDPGGLVSLNAQTMNSIKLLREEPAMAKKCMLNVIGHSAGAIHVKGAVIGTKPDGTGKSKAIAFSGGLDFVEDRWAKYGHMPDDSWDSLPALPRWHDVQAAIQGPAAQGFYNHFRDMWNENLRREAKRFNFEGARMPSYVPNTEAVPERVTDQFLFTPANPPKHHVQSIRTIPAFNYHWYNCLPENPPVSYAPNGLFEIKAAWRKAILGAQTYIYMEDQMYWGREIMSWINEAIRSNPDLKVIMALSGAADPNDPATPGEDEYLHESFNIGLLGIGTPEELNAAQRDRIRIFRMWGESFATDETMMITAVTDVSPVEVLVETAIRLNATAPSVPEDAFAGKNIFFSDGGGVFWEVTGNPKIEPGGALIFRLDPHGVLPTAGSPVAVASTFGLVMHSKVTLIDDKWAIIGSANVACRSLYTDWEHAVGFIDETESAVRDFRARLWAEHFHDAPSSFYDLNDAIGAWDPAWATASSPVMPMRPYGDLGPPYLQPAPLPLPIRPITQNVRTVFETLRDADSRKDWGGVCPPSQ